MSPADGVDATAGWAVAIGSIGVFATSVAYVLAPPVAALPAPSSRWIDGQAAMRAGGSLWWAGTIGPAFDLVLIAGAMLCALASITTPGRRDGRGAVGWILVSVATLIFTVVDGMAGRVLPVLAARDQDLEAYLAARALFDVLFISGTMAFGFGAACIALGLERPWLRGCVLVTAVVAGVSSVGCLVGAGWGQPLGGSILIGSALFAWIGVSMVARARHQTLPGNLAAERRQRRSLSTSS